MPKLVFNEPTLNGQAFICKYEDRKYFNLRVKREGHRYTHISLNTDDIEIARKNALDCYVKVVSTPPRSSKETTTIKRIGRFYPILGNMLRTAKTQLGHA